MVFDGVVRPSNRAARYKVLLVDDDAVSLEVLAAMLDCDGHEVLKAGDGETALGLLAGLLAGPGLAAPPDALLVDMRMPGLSGCELAERVRAMEGRKPLLVAMSATAAGARQLRGFDSFLLKPPGLDDLRRALAGKKESKRRGRAPRPQTPSAGRQGDGIDQAVLSKLKQAMPLESLKELYAACLEDARARAAALRKQVEAGRLEEIPREAHQIKGAAAMVGASRIAGLASSLELGSCKEEDTLRLLDDLLAACDGLERMLLGGKL